MKRWAKINQFDQNIKKEVKNYQFSLLSNSIRFVHLQKLIKICIYNNLVLS
jgi:hypothetical protein